MSGYDKAKATIDGIKEEVANEQAQKEEGKKEVINQLAVISKNAELAKMYQDSAQVGAGNLAGELPLLKVQATGKSQNELEDGSEPSDGNFFYKPTKEQFGTIKCHILTISKGFRAEGLNGKGEVFNQILGGVIMDGNDLKPFIMYMTGKKLNGLWAFGKEASNWTRRKPISIPMFALTVELSTRKEINNYGSSWLIDFKIVKDEEGNPVLVMDPGEFTFLKDEVETIEDTVASLIARKAKEEEVVTPIHAEGEEPSDIPF